MKVPMRALSSPPQSKMSVSPIPSPSVKMTYPTSAPARPKPSDTAQEVGPLMFRNTSPGISTRAITPQTNPSSRAPTMSTSSCENRDSS
jgi:hypothetical protein